MSLVNALTNDLNHFKEPFNHWTLENPLSETLIDEVYDIKFPEGDVIFDGTRAGDKTGNNLLSKLRVFITKENSFDYPELHQLVKEMQSKECTDLISKMLNRNLSNSFVRIEVIADKNGFWLEPHCDIKEKLMSSIVFVNLNDEPENLGTDFYDKKRTKVKTVPYKHNYGYFFTSGPNSWHGMEKKEIKKERRCIQINYVTFETDWKVK